MNVKTLIFLCLFPFTAIAQGFAGLGTQADGFAVPTPDPTFDFPKDHGPHNQRGRHALRAAMDVVPVCFGI
jgi:predicted secreted hydrolase